MIDKQSIEPSIDNVSTHRSVTEDHRAPARCRHRRRVTEDHRLQPARELFFTYDGSRFYMSRDGVEQDYLRFAVPREVETAWLEEALSG